MADKNTYKLNSVRVSGGFLDGMSFDFSPNMNCIIGARGAGKTSLVELVRFALMREPGQAYGGSPARKRFDDIIGGSLGQGRVELSVTSPGGTKYVISRAAGAQPVVCDADRQPTGQKSVHSVFTADIFSQNEVETIAGRHDSQLLLLESFDRARIASLNADVVDFRNKLDVNFRSTCDVKSEIDRLETKCQRKTDAEKELDECRKAGGGISDDMDEANALRTQRENEKRHAASLARVFQELERRVREFGAAVSSRGIVAWKEEDFSCTQNAMHVASMRQAVGRGLDAVERSLEEIQESLAAAREDFAQAEQQLETAHAGQDAEYMEMAVQAQADSAMLERRLAAERELEEIAGYQRDLEDRRRELAGLEAERETLKAGLEKALEARFAARLAIAERLNAELGPDIRVEIHQYGGLERYQTLIADRLRWGSASVQVNQVAEKLARAVHPASLIEIVRSRDTAALSGGILNANQARAVVNAFSAPDAIAALEVVDLPDRPSILLRDKDIYKPTEILSTGQKCNAILPILLLDSDRPLVIDQPEDNLDNALIHSLVVKSILKVKRHRQLLFVTHNPNIPVLGEAEQVLVFSSDGTHGSIEKRGTVDDCKQEIVNLLEGGAEAFRKRSRCYELK